MANPKAVKRHALQRLRSRQGVKDRNVVDDLVKEVLEKGTRVKDLPPSELRDILFKRFPSNTQRKRAYYYNEYIYIFTSDKKLITTYKFERRYGEYVK